ncbi:MAG: hypothetical protein J5I93_07920 [Pirellulaceae bacterium]|nr:hypothetical protein [Pirellulaceae bacterium]
MQLPHVADRVQAISMQFRRDRATRQGRQTLAEDDFQHLAQAGLSLLAVPASQGGLWTGVQNTVRPLAELLRTLARGDSSVALVCAMHPAVLSYWLTAPEPASDGAAWDAQCREIYESVHAGCWWGTITSEPGSGGDVHRTRAIAAAAETPLRYHLSGNKHFGSGSGIMSFMVTTAIAEGEQQADWFYLDVRGVPWDGSRGMRLLAPWDGHGMTATQSHAFAFERFPATRIARPGLLPETAARTGGFIGALFISVVVGIVDEAMDYAGARMPGDPGGAYQRVEWTQARTEHWLIQQAFEGVLRAVESQADSRQQVLLGKTAIAELSERLLTRLCRLSGGSSFSRRSPLGHWFEDVRALGFLRPPWALAFQTLEANP